MLTDNEIKELAKTTPYTYDNVKAVAERVPLKEVTKETVLKCLNIMSAAHVNLSVLINFLAMGGDLNEVNL